MNTFNLNLSDQSLGNLLYLLALTQALKETSNAPKAITDLCATANQDNPITVSVSEVHKDTIEILLAENGDHGLHCSADCILDDGTLANVVFSFWVDADGVLNASMVSGTTSAV